MTARPIIIDCDPGQDDAVALFLAMSSPEELQILGITTVAGKSDGGGTEVQKMAAEKDPTLFGSPPTEPAQPEGNAANVAGGVACVATAAGTGRRQVVPQATSAGCQGQAR